MTPRTAAVVVVGICLLVSGCSAISGSERDDHGQHRFVVENTDTETQNITVTIETASSGRLVNETRQLTSGEQWIVATVDTSVLTDGYQMDISGEYSSQYESRGRGPGATLIELGGGHHLTCGGEPTCYEQTD